MERVKIENSVTTLEKPKEVPDIYSGDEKMRFNNRHPIFKTLMKLEFEDVLRGFNQER
jgi:hypothetical protein